jgi:hypothetical protein
VSAPDRLRAPQQDGTILAVPSLDQVGDLLTENRRRLADGPPFLGRDWNDLRRQARRVAIAAAEEYLHRAGEPVPFAEANSLVLAGHQPDLFHPGVWVKNFALQAFARRHGATPVNLVVDNDTVKATTLAIPAASVPLPPVNRSRPQRLAVQFDRWIHETPYEERTVLDEGLFAKLPTRARQAWGYVPLLEDFWAEVLRQAQQTPLLGQRFAAARRSFERSWGCHNLELPVSSFCRSEPFAWFACSLLDRLPSLHALYNATVHGYRRRHGIRSRSHPVPDLAAEGDWLESPFWAWQAGQGQRQRLMVRRSLTGLEFRAGKMPWPSLPSAKDGQGSAMVAAWREWEGHGFKVRSRALTTTLYARLLLGDLFIHGIGGAKYDELTDDLIRGFFHIEPPRFLVLSATLLLPLPHYSATAEECRRLAQRRRDFHWNPQRHLPTSGGIDSSLVDKLAKEKMALAAKPATSAPQGRERFHELRRLNAELRLSLCLPEKQLAEDLRRSVEEVEANRVLQRRDYAFCLYPEAQLREFCTRFLQG